MDKQERFCFVNASAVPCVAKNMEAENLLKAGKIFKYNGSRRRAVAKLSLIACVGEDFCGSVVRGQEVECFNMLM